MLSDVHRDEPARAVSALMEPSREAHFLPQPDALLPDSIDRTLFRSESLRCSGSFQPSRARAACSRSLDGTKDGNHRDTRDR